MSIMGESGARILTGHEGVAIILADVEEKARNAVADAEVRRRAELEKIGKAIDKMVTKWEAECKRERAPPLRVAKEAAKVAVKLYPSIAPSDVDAQPQTLHAVVNCRRIGKGRFPCQLLADVRGSKESSESRRWIESNGL